MTFEYEFGPADWLAFGTYRLTHSRTRRRQRFWPRLGISATIVIPRLSLRGVPFDELKAKVEEYQRTAIPMRQPPGRLPAEREPS